MLENDNTAIEAESPEVSGSGQSVADIVNDTWPKGDATETPAPATGSASTETGKGKDQPKSDPAPEAPKPTLFTVEQVGKLTQKDIANPSFDWTKVPPELVPLLKGWQGDHTRLNQLAAATRRPERKEPTPQPTDTPAPDPTDEANKRIVADALKSLGIDPDVAAKIVEDGVASQGAMLAAQAVPRYAEDAAFMEAVHQAVAADEELIELAESKDPKLIARALKIGALRVERDELVTKVSSSDQRSKDLDAREAKLAEGEKQLETIRKELEQERAKYQRGKSTVAGGTPSGAPGKPAGPPDVKSIVDESWPAQGLRVG